MKPSRRNTRTSRRSKSGELVLVLLVGASIGTLLILVAFVAFTELNVFQVTAPSASPPYQSTEAPLATPTEPTQGLLPGGDSQDILNRCFKGTVAFRYPEPLKQGETVEFVVRAVLLGSPADPTEGLPGQGPAQTRTTRTCEQMRAELSGPDMVITRTGNQSGKVSLPSEGMGEWVWQVKPQKSGAQYLTLRLFVPGSEDSDITLESFTERIHVEVGLTYVVAGFVKDYLPALGISIPVILGWVAWAVNKRLKGKHAKATE